MVATLMALCAMFIGLTGILMASAAGKKTTELEERIARLEKPAE